MLSVVGGAVGLAAASSSLGLIVKSFGTTLSRGIDVTLDMRVLAFTGSIAVLTGLIAGVAPAWRMTRGDPNEALKQGMGRSGSHAGERRVRNLLVTAEVALALMLLVGAGLLIRTLWQLRAVDPGFDAPNLLTMHVLLPDAKYPKPEQRAQFFDETLRRVRALPGVDSASGDRFAAAAVPTINAACRDRGRTGTPVVRAAGVGRPRRHAWVSVDASHARARGSRLHRCGPNRPTTGGPRQRLNSPVILAGSASRRQTADAWSPVE